MRDRLQKFRSKRTYLLNKNKEYHKYEIEETRLEPGSIWTSKGNVSTLSGFKASTKCEYLEEVRSHK